LPPAERSLSDRVSRDRDPDRAPAALLSWRHCGRGALFPNRHVRRCRVECRDRQPAPRVHRVWCLARSRVLLLEI